MYKVSYIKPTISALFAIALVVGIAWPRLGLAAQAANQFNVKVRLQTSAPESAFCRSSNAPGSFGATITVVCATGAVVDIAPRNTGGMPWSPMHGGAYRYLFSSNAAGYKLDSIDDYAGVGSIASWRVIDLSSWKYLEMLVNW